MAKRLVPSFNRALPSKTTLNSAKVGVAGLNSRYGNDVPASVKEGDILLSNFLIREKGHHIGASRTCVPEHNTETNHFHQVVSRGYLPWSNCFYGSTLSFAKFSLGGRALSSQAGQSSNEENNMEDGCSELETPSSDVTGERSREEINEDSHSESELDEDEADDSLRKVSHEELELSDTEQAEPDDVSSKKRFSSDLYKLIKGSNRKTLPSVLNKWDEEGKALNQSEISLIMINLRKTRMYGKALQFLEWLELKQKLTVKERDYASRLDLIAKVHGNHHAEKYIENIPESFRGEVIYRTLLVNYIASNNMKKAEEVFNKMRDLDFRITPYICNQLLKLYKKLDKKKIPDVLLFMENKSIKPTRLTFRLLIDAKGKSNDMTGMEHLLDTMKEQGFEPDVFTQAMVARHYIQAGQKEKAEAVLKEMEGGNLEENRSACQALLPIYADLGKADDVDRVWKVCDADPSKEEYLAAIEAWGKVGKIEVAEAVFERMNQKWNLKRPSSWNYTTLLKVYADNKMLTKGKDLAKRIEESGCNIGPWTWDALVKLYVEAGEVEKADSILEKAAQGNRAKPRFYSFMTVMDEYAKRGDVHNAEKMLHLLKLSGYSGLFLPYQTLLDAYIKAKVPAYGLRERMKVDKIIPARYISKLAQVDGFKKTTFSELLD